MTLNDNVQCINGDLNGDLVNFYPDLINIAFYRFKKIATKSFVSQIAGNHGQFKGLVTREQLIILLIKQVRFKLLKQQIQNV